jgi:serine/threonine protein kinase
VTEYHERGTLDRHLDIFKGDALAALEAYKPLVDAICRIHEKGAIHRDIKTENIFVTKAGNLVLGDFGIVFLQEGSQRLTTTYERVGSHEWMAPWANKKEKLEQSEINTALDIFPLAKVLWSMIAGRNGPSFWEYDRDENNLATLFPDDPTMPLINQRIFATRIVREERQCDSSAQNLRKDVEELIRHVKGIRKFRQKGAEEWPCQVCGRGRYRSSGPRYKLTGFREGGPMNELNKTLYVSICEHCGHAELFDR